MRTARQALDTSTRRKPSRLEHAEADEQAAEIGSGTASTRERSLPEDLGEDLEVDVDEVNKGEKQVLKHSKRR